MSFRKVFKGLLIFLGGVVLLIAAFFIFAVVSDKGMVTLPVEHKEAFQNENSKSFPSLLQAQGNKIKNLSGENVILKGLMAPDPVKLHRENNFSKGFFEGIKATGANVIRIPVHPENYYRDKDYLWRYLDPLVSWAGEMNMYVIIDWHYIGNVDDGSGNQMPDIDISPKEFTEQFWKQTAGYFKDASHVIFEIFNEPADINADVWAKNANEIINTIRSQGANQLVIVGGVEYSKDLSWVHPGSINDKNIAYTSHIYPAHSKLLWPSYFGDISKEYPVLITEWGFIDENRYATKQNYLIGSESTYGKPFIDFLDERGIGWIACWYDDEWEPEMFNKNFKSYTNFGQFVINQLKK